MFKKILLATDGSDHSIKAAHRALELALKHSSQVEIISVAQYLHEPIEHTELQVALQLRDANKFKARMKEQGKAIVEKTAQYFVEKNVPYEAKVEVGDPADIICQEAEEKEIDLIIIGTRGNSGVSRFLLGSVSSKVVSHAPCSVLVVR